MKLVTYATHSEGSFEELLNSGYPIEVLGWGTKWNGFMDKFQGVKSYLDTLEDDEIVVFLDGFDSMINKDLSDLTTRFASLDCKVLVSHENKSGLSNFLPSGVHLYITRSVFGTCKDGETANTGLYMGYVKELKQVVDKVLLGTSDDDQRNFNQLCSNFPFLKVDTENIIFENCPNISEAKNSKAYFTQVPANLTLNRTIRSIKEYSKYFILEVLLVLILIFYLFK